MKDKIIDELCQKVINESNYPNKNVILNAKEGLIKTKKASFKDKIFNFKIVLSFSSCLLIIFSSLGIYKLISLNNKEDINYINNDYTILSSDDVNEETTFNENDETNIFNIVPFFDNLTKFQAYTLNKDIDNYKKGSLVAYDIKGSMLSNECEVFIENKGLCFNKYNEYKTLDLTKTKSNIKYYSNKLDKFYFVTSSFQYNLKLSSKATSYLDIIDYIDTKINSIGLN